MRTDAPEAVARRTGAPAGVQGAPAGVARHTCKGRTLCIAHNCKARPAASLRMCQLTSTINVAGADGAVGAVGAIGAVSAIVAVGAAGAVGCDRRSRRSD